MPTYENIKILPTRVVDIINDYLLPDYEECLNNFNKCIEELNYWYNYPEPDPHPLDFLDEDDPWYDLV
jgi:hypothetical protein